MLIIMSLSGIAAGRRNYKSKALRYENLRTFPEWGLLYSCPVYDQDFGLSEEITKEDMLGMVALGTIACCSFAGA